MKNVLIIGSTGQIGCLLYTSAMDTHGFGMSSVRFICGTQDLHKQLEAAISDYFKTCLLYTSEVEKVLREEVKAAIDNSYNVLRTRIDRFGVHQPEGCCSAFRRWLYR